MISEEQGNLLEDRADALVNVIRVCGIRSIAIPPLGCGNGGLNWQDVRPLIIEVFADLPAVDVMLYPPAAEVASQSPVNQSSMDM